MCTVILLLFMYTVYIYNKMHIVNKLESTCPMCTMLMFIRRKLLGFIRLCNRERTMLTRLLYSRKIVVLSRYMIWAQMITFPHPHHGVILFHTDLHNTYIVSFSSPRSVARTWKSLILLFLMSIIITVTTIATATTNEGIIT